jgi:NhaA family Na+:H+ antiporter
LRQATKAFVDNSGLLVLGTVIAIAWANIDPASYFDLSHRLHFVVNDVAMAFFFALAAKEVTEATAPGGALHSPRRAAMPLVAAVGGMLGPALIFIALTIEFDRPDLERGWAIPCATDIAFSYLVARLVFGAKHPAIPFLLLLAIADDALGLLIIAAFYPTGPLRPVDFVILLASGVLIASWLRQRRTKTFWPYVLAAGAVSWIGFYRGGLHPALALVPIIPFLPHAAHWFKRPVDVMLFFFGVVNAGVVFENAGAGTWFVLGAIIVGKPIGIVTATAFSRLGGLHLPRGVNWRDVAVVGIIAGIGFTVALFFATAAFPYGRLLNETKLGALLSFSAGLLGVAAAKILKVGRFS